MSPDDAPGDPEAIVRTARGDVLFVQVPDPKTARNRAHLDLQPSDRTRDEEVARVRELGAVLVDDQRRDDGTGWVVLADPEGNEFCVLRSQAERAAVG
jgi:predicted enzyme related to lactoylglutathione lyase